MESSGGFFSGRESVPADSSFLVNPDKIIDGPVVATFYIIGEITGRQFSHFPVVADAIAAHSFFTAGIRTITVLQVILFFTFHELLFMQIFEKKCLE